MRAQTTHSELIASFLDAVRAKQLDRCQAIMADLGRRAAHDASLTAWLRYCQGILANERDHDWAAAERIFLELLNETPDLDRELAGRLHLALGVTYRRQNRLQACIAICERSLPIYAEMGDPVGQAKALKQIVIAYGAGFDQGDFGPDVLPAALQTCQNALQLLEALPEPSSSVRWLTGTLWNEYGALHRALGGWDEAIRGYRRYLEICRSLDHRFGMGLAYGNLGEVYLKQGPEAWPQAQTAFQNALETLQGFEDRYQTLEALSNLAFMQQQIGDLAAALAAYSQAIDVIASIRAGVTSEAARAGFFATVTDTFANAVHTAVQAGRQSEAFDLVERARSRAFLDMLAAGSAKLERRKQAETLTLAQVQAALPADALLLEYFTSGVVEARDRQAGRLKAQRHRFPPAKTLIFAVTRDHIAVHDANMSPNDLHPRRLDSVVERHFLRRQIRRALYDKLIGPVERLLAGKGRVYLVPHGPLHYIPFQALLAPDGETLLRQDGPELVFGPSASVLFGGPDSRPFGFQKTGRASHPCLALGYNGEGANRLRFAEEEARCIANLTGGRALAGPAAKKALLFEQAGDHRFLHISCHGDFDPQAPLQSALHLAADETLTAQEALERLRLRCDLVTLSACESGLSRVRRGDELMGLIRAFMIAGAPAVVATLWRVDERSTRIVMERFYQEVAGGAAFATALKRVQLYLRNLTGEEALAVLGHSFSGADDKPFADPFYWAPFVLVGGGALR